MAVGAVIHECGIACLKPTLQGAVGAYRILLSGLASQAATPQSLTG
ncbi:hypothetical protein GbCGDNIH3_5017 [Granulibacter bethesdensis]|uniref:Uncharacterized protein n=1 Tax=Granulibacter bethesdensis TaxID=364410 RepID=A0AAN0RCF4_9PROT|nr:hypothetical protein GbCGDNIH3_5017 [Granulibacter bethesdensis]AHJ64838.1 hypothetical protein GbCGDNIH4_5017 [Granulibacter bethesdensis CGDNIH4]APH58750.1 hypothetical protein GbCGDNIH7_5017 [Granulibacter bethesdensis]